jgi:hypothetical protein
MAKLDLHRFVYMKQSNRVRYLTRMVDANPYDVVRKIKLARAIKQFDQYKLMMSVTKGKSNAAHREKLARMFNLLIEVDTSTETAIRDGSDSL